MGTTQRDGIDGDVAGHMGAGWPVLGEPVAYCIKNQISYPASGPKTRLRIQTSIFYYVLLGAVAPLPGGGTGAGEGAGGAGFGGFAAAAASLSFFCRPAEAR